MEQSTDAVIALAAAVREQANAFLLRALAERGVTDLLPAHGAVLHALFRQGPLRMSALAEAIDRRKNTVTGLIKTLEERGYCRREPDPADARVQRIVLTARGEGLRGMQEEISAAMLRTAWRGMDREEREACVRGLCAVLENLKRDAMLTPQGECHE